MAARLRRGATLRTLLMEAIAQGPIESLQQRGRTVIGNDDFIGSDLGVDAAGLGNRYQWSRRTLLLQKFCHLLHDVSGKRIERTQPYLSGPAITVCGDGYHCGASLVTIS